MRAEGCDIKVDYRDMAYMGFVAVLANIHKVKRNLSTARAALLQEKPDVLILIDYPSFNLRIAKFCHEQLPKTRIIYYIPPKIWAWKEWRVHKIAQYADEILGIFPFEPAFYAKHGYTCRYVGNPTSDCIRAWKEQQAGEQGQNSKPMIALLPGSRPSEISHCLPVMLAAAREVAGEDYQIVFVDTPGVQHTKTKLGEYMTQATDGATTDVDAIVIDLFLYKRHSIKAFRFYGIFFTLVTQIITCC